MFWIVMALADPCTGLSPCSVVSTTPTPLGQVVHRKLSANPEDGYRGIGTPCVRESWSLFKPDGSESLILSVCNDGYGASGIGEDSVGIVGTAFTHRQNGGSAWRWWNETTIDLETYQVLAFGGGGGHMNLTDDKYFDLRTFRGRLESHYCVGEEEFDAAVPLIPSVAARDEVPALGDCALQVDSKNGPIVHGVPGEVSDASMKVLMVGDQLIVDVRDDRYVEKAKSWIRADHLEIWASSGQSDPCGSLPKPVQWGVLLTGEVIPAHGEPDSLRAMVDDLGSGKRFVIEGLPEHSRLSVVYSDSDDGKGQERMIGTSAVKFATWNTLSAVQPIEPKYATCAGDPLMPLRTPHSASPLDGTP